MGSMFGLPSAALSFALAAILATCPGMASSATLVDIGHAAGKRCSAAAINNSGTSVGRCTSADAYGPAVAWLALLGGEQVPLKVLAPGHACSAGGITDSGIAIGRCLDDNDHGFAVAWAGPGAEAVKLKPLPGVLGLLVPGVTTTATAFTKSGKIAGQSVDGRGVATAVLWSSTSGQPEQVSAAGDNCIVADMKDGASSKPYILLDCPDGNGGTRPKLDTAAGLLGTYVATLLPVLPGADDCTATGLNEHGIIVGTCTASSPPSHRAVYWSSPTAAPTPITVAGSLSETWGVAVNGNDNVLVVFRTDGVIDGFIHSTKTGQQFRIPLPTANTSVVPTGFADDDVVLLQVENLLHLTQAAFYTLGEGELRYVPPLEGGTNSMLVALSTNGAYAAGVAETTAQGSEAVTTSLP